jgi:hypothetical protein
LNVPAHELAAIPRARAIRIARRIEGVMELYLERKSGRDVVAVIKAAPPAKMNSIVL